MRWFTKEGLLAWRQQIPDDIVVCIEEITDEGQEAADFIAKMLPAIEKPDDFLNLVKDNQEKFIEMGRARRLRFLAWCTARLYRETIEREKLIVAITNLEKEGDGESSSGNAGPYFLEDIKAFAEAIGPRAAALIVDENTLKTISGVGFEIANEIELTRGGR